MIIRLAIVIFLCSALLTVYSQSSRNKLRSSILTNSQAGLYESPSIISLRGVHTLPPKSLHARSSLPVTLTTIEPDLSRRKTAKSSYFPGKLNKYENGLILSEGLKSKIIARGGSKVMYQNGKESYDNFHKRPDGAAVFETRSGGWIYASNSELSKGKGGVGAITFDRKGRVIKYKRILKNTSRNCQGGKTPWNTWISCEEDGNKGQCWETDPFGKLKPQKTKLGGSGGNFEAVAIDDRDMYDLTFFVTHDKSDGEIRRFTPDSSVLWNAMENKEPLSILTSPGKIEYLILEPKDKSGKCGTFYWTRSIRAGRTSAYNYFRSCEGIDAVDGRLYFASSTQKEIFTLNLDGGTYCKESTIMGEFTGQPDQVKYLHGDSDILYISEEKDNNIYSGVYGRKLNGRQFPILIAGRRIKGDIGGIAFSPDNRHMYVAFLRESKLYDITREDNQPFHGSTIDVRYSNKN